MSFLTNNKRERQPGIARGLAGLWDHIRALRARARALWFDFNQRKSNPFCRQPIAYPASSACKNQSKSEHYDASSRGCPGYRESRLSLPVTADQMTTIDNIRDPAMSANESIAADPVDEK